MWSRAAFCLVLSAAAVLAEPARGEDKQRVIERCKKATAFISARFRDREAVGSAFCVDPRGLYVTSTHIVGSGFGDLPDVRLVVEPGTSGQRFVNGKILKSDTNLDLALILADTGGQSTPLELGEEEKLFETMDIIAFGFPLGRTITPGQAYPGVSVNTGRITSLRKETRDDLRRIQVDAVLVPGNSGGPVVDEKGRVIGVVRSGILGAGGINFVIPPRVLAYFLRAGATDFVPSPIKGEDRKQPVTWRIRIFQVPQDPALGVTVVLENPFGPPRKLPARPGKAPGSYEVTFVPLPDARINPDGFHGIPYSIFLKPNGREWQVASGNLMLTPPRIGTTLPSPLGSRDWMPRQITPPPLPGNQKSVRLPGNISAVTLGGGGQFLLLSMKSSGQLAVIDVSKAEIARLLPLPPGPSLVAAGAHKIIVLAQDDRIIQRWELATFKKEKTEPLVGAPDVQAMALGSDSDGPILTRWKDPGPATGYYVTLIDLETLQPIRQLSSLSRQFAAVMERDGLAYVRTNMSSYGKIYVSASADGRVFGLCSDSMMGTIVARSGSFMVSEQTFPAIVEALLPSPDGRRILGLAQSNYGQGSIVFNPMLVPPLLAVDSPALNGLFPPRILREPSTDPQWDLGIEGLTDPRANLPRSNDGSPPVRTWLYAAGDDRPILSLHALDEMAGLKLNWQPGEIEPNQRFQLIPAAQVLLTIPPSNDQVVFRRLDIGAELARSKYDYLFVRSRPVDIAWRNEAYRYKVEVSSRAGDVRYELSVAPEGMTLAPDGTLTWDHPTAADNHPVTVVVTITDRSSQEVLHVFDIEVK